MCLHFTSRKGLPSGTDEPPNKDKENRDIAHLLVDALQAVEALKLAQLQHAREGGPHVPAQLILRPLLALGVTPSHASSPPPPRPDPHTRCLGGGLQDQLDEAGMPRRLWEDHADLSHPRRFQQLGLSGEELLAKASLRRDAVVSRQTRRESGNVGLVRVDHVKEAPYLMSWELLWIFF